MDTCWICEKEIPAEEPRGASVFGSVGLCCLGEDEMDSPLRFGDAGDADAE